MRLEETEEFRGSLVSPNLVRGYPRGYALYMTNKRIIGVKKAKVGIAGLLAPVKVGPVGGLVTENTPKEVNAKIVQELDGRKDFALRWNDIRRIEFKKPGLLIGGHAIFIPVSEEAVTVKIGTKKDLEMLVSLIRKFLPDDRLSGL